MSRSGASVIGPRTPGAPQRARGAATLLVAFALALTGCSDDGEDAAPESTTATARRSTVESSSTTATPGSTGTSQPSGSVEEQIASRYVAFWEARFAANQNPPNPDDPRLAEYASGEQLQNVVSETRARRDDGLALRAPDPSVTSHNVQVISVEGESAELQDCFVNDGVLYNAATGEIVDDSVVTRSVSAVLVIEGGVWKLARASVIQEWEGVAGCALTES
jgi:hypothetical protein